VANELIHGNSIEAMSKMSDGSIDLTVTSPPYDDLRTYNDSSKWDFDVFKKVAEQLYRVTADGGVVMWNVNDATINGGESGSSFRQALHFMELGFRLHDTMIYEKSGISFASGPKSVRYSQAFEYMFILSKGKPKTVNILMDKPNKWAGVTTWGNAKSRQKDGTLVDSGKKSKPIREFGARTNIWYIKNSGGFGQKDDKAYKHPATMPLSMAVDHIKTWTNEGDVVLDPFMGSGTTGIACEELGRDFIGIEIDETYYNLSVERLGVTV